jgi:hypothetical protein
MDFFASEIRRNPFPLYSRLRAASPVLDEPRIGALMIVDLAGARHARTDYTRFNASEISADSAPSTG